MSDVKVTLGADSSELKREVEASTRILKKFEDQGRVVHKVLGNLSGEIQMTTGPMSRFNAQAAAIPGRMKDAKAGMSGAGAGMLALSNAAQDATYGMRGALNNIPQLVMGLGGGMGLAGVAMGAAVAYDLFSRKIEESTKKMQEQLDVMAQSDPAFLAHIAARQAAANAGAVAAQKHNEQLAEEQAQMRQAKVAAQQRAAAEEQVNAKLREQIGLARRNIDEAGMDPQAVREKRTAELLEEARTTSMPTARAAAPGSLKTADDLKRLINEAMKSGETFSLAEQARLLELLDQILKLEKETSDVQKERTAEAEAKKASQAEAINGLNQELEISRLLAAGETEKAALLQKEIALRREAASLAVATGQSEADVLAKLRERETNREAGEERAKTPEKTRGVFNAAESAVRRAARVSDRDRTGGRMSNTDKLALANEERRNQQRNDRSSRDTPATGDKILQQILETQKKQIEVWNKLTTSSK